MKQLSKHITEALKISSKSKVHGSGLLDPDDFKDMETPGYDWDGEEMILVGKPFKNKTTKEYLDTKCYIKNNGYTIYNDLEDIDFKEDFDYFVYARYNADKELNCFVYGFDGAYAEDK